MECSNSNHVRYVFPVWWLLSQNSSMVDSTGISRLLNKNHNSVSCSKKKSIGSPNFTPMATTPALACVETQPLPASIQEGGFVTRVRWNLIRYLLDTVLDTYLIPYLIPTLYPTWYLLDTVLDTYLIPYLIPTWYRTWYLLHTVLDTYLIPYLIPAWYRTWYLLDTVLDT